MDDVVRREIETLRTMKSKALKARYRELFGEDSRSSNRTHLFRRVAWRLQATAEGELSEQARQRAAELASDADLRLRPPPQFRRELDGEEEKHGNVPRDLRLPLAGAELTRKYQGRLIVVRVLEDGFEFKGQRFDSLSAIASRVSGTRWNGYSFFGLKAEVENG